MIAEHAIPRFQPPRSVPSRPERAFARAAWRLAKREGIHFLAAAVRCQREYPDLWLDLCLSRGIEPMGNTVERLKAEELTEGHE